MNAYKMDFPTKTLTITKAFSDACANPSSTEYAILHQFQKDIPNLKIVRKTHRTPTKYHTAEGEVLTRNKNKGLTYERMERFIDALPRAEEYRKQYDFINAYSVNPYDLASKWFMKQFPNYRTNPLYYALNDAKIVRASDFIIVENANATEKMAGKK